MVPFIILRTDYHRAFIFHMLIGPGESLIPIDFFVLYGKGQGHIGHFREKHVLAQFLEKYL